MQPNWYAIKTKQDIRAESALAEKCDDVFFPKTNVMTHSGKLVQRPVIPHVLFIKTTRDNALALEKKSRMLTEGLVPFWIYRYTKGGEIQIITDDQIRLVRLLSADDTSRCEIFSKTGFTGGQTVEVTGGIYKGYRGVVQRVRKNRHVVVEIKGVCMIMLPFIHPDLLRVVDD